MRLKHDKEADAIYIYLTDTAYSYGEDLDNERRIDYDKNGNPIGIELLCVSRGVIVDNLPHSAEIAKLLEAKKIKVFA
jgi:uncharacterized protein YuzE